MCIGICVNVRLCVHACVNECIFCVCACERFLCMHLSLSLCAMYPQYVGDNGSPQLPVFCCFQ